MLWTSQTEDWVLRYQHVAAEGLVRADDWRPDYHLSPSAVLPRIGAEWPSVADLGGRLHDGWRFSDRVESDWYLRNVALRDPSQRNPLTGEHPPLSATSAEQQRASQYRETIEGERYYRMRHVGEMVLHVDAALMEQPSLNDLNACVAPMDVVVRRVGHISAALVSSFHRRHPVDGNLALLRGLSPRQAAWAAYCLNQPIYRSYFEQPGAISSMVRLGLKQLASMPLANRPAAFDELADQYWQHYERLMQAEDRLQQLREEVADWLAERVPERLLNTRPGELAAQRFDAKDIGGVLNYSATEQNKFCRELTEVYQCVPLSQLADINPKGAASVDTSYRVIKIGDITGQLDIHLNTPTAQESRWRYHRRPLNPMTALVATFVQEPKVGLLSDALPAATLASEQLVVLNFHRTPGAYALLLETNLVRQQIARIATGTVQRFAHPEQFKQLAVPEIDERLAQSWHQQLIEIQHIKAEARRELGRLDRAMYRVYRQVHPELSPQHQGEAQHEENA